uniref:WASH_WAHD domain-containing protein n=1 Tax=Heterorhabditis bacteriophora TaxID=37862 RepID=A0A1I7WV35_HETBA
MSNSFSFKIVSNGSSFESGIDKYVNSCGDPDAGQFLVLLRRLVFNNITCSKQVMQNYFQALRKEADELRLMANKNTPYNPKLKKVFDHRLYIVPPRRPSLGFDETIDFNQDLIDSAFKLTKPKATFVSKLESDTRSGERFSFNYVSVVKEDKELDFPKFPDVDSLDDDSMLDVTIPKSIIDRVISGSPKKKPNGLGGLQRPAVAALENLEFSFCRIFKFGYMTG